MGFQAFYELTIQNGFMALTPVDTITASVTSWIEKDGGSNALLLITVDGYVRPHVMMLARDEVRVCSDALIRVAVGERSRSAENLRARASATLAIYDADLACAIKTRVVLGPRALVEGTVAFDLAVEDFHLDRPAASESSARLISGLGFEGRAPRLDLRAALEQLDG